MTSFYTGPDRPSLRVNTWGDLVAAAQAGALTETQWVELKAGLPAAAQKANLELARDLASLSVDGGILLIGVRDPGQASDDVEGVDEDVESLKSRVSQVAVGRIQPPLNVTLSVLVDPEVESRYVLLVAVPASRSAPHMVDERYWGRSATGKRPLSDAETSRLWAERRTADDDLERRLLTAPDEVAQLWPVPRQLGLTQLLLEPPLGHTGLRERPVDETAVLNAASFRPTWGPSLAQVTTTLPHPDGVSFASFNPAHETFPEQYRLHVLVLDSGVLRVLAPATRPFGSADSGPLCISVNALMELAHQAVELADRIGREHLGTTGAWTVGVHLDGLAGVHSAQSLSESMFAFQGRPYPRSTYTRTTTANSQQLHEQPAQVVEALLGDLARGLGLQRMLFPYTDPQKIQERGIGG